MKNITRTIKTLCFLMFALVLFTGCEFGGKADVNLYSLTLTTSSNVTLTPEQKAAYTVEFVDGAIDEDEKQALLSDGASEEDIEKAGKLQPDGKYYFFDQNKVYVNVPDIPGYRFIGFFIDGEIIDYKPIDNNPRDGKQDYWWNTLNKDTILEARYEYLKYSISYCDNVHGGLIPTSMLTNPTTYDGEVAKTVILNDPATIPGYEFKYWYYNEIIFDEGENAHTEQVICTELPSIGREGVVNTVGINQYELTLFAYYEIASYEVTITIDEGLELWILQSVASNGETTNLTLGDEPLVLQAGTEIDFAISYGDIDVVFPDGLHEFDGIYINGERLDDLDYGDGLMVPNNHPDLITVNGNMTIEAKVKMKSPVPED